MWPFKSKQKLSVQLFTSIALKSLLADETASGFSELAGVPIDSPGYDGFKEEVQYFAIMVAMDLILRLVSAPEGKVSDAVADAIQVELSDPGAVHTLDLAGFAERASSYKSFVNVQGMTTRQSLASQFALTLCRALGADIRKDSDTPQFQTALSTFSEIGTMLYDFVDSVISKGSREFKVVL